jgi:hypothetical protein
MAVIEVAKVGQEATTYELIMTVSSRQFLVLVISSSYTANALNEFYFSSPYRHHNLRA